MEAIFAILGSVFSGGVTGIFGVFVQKIFDYKKQQQDIQLVQISPPCKTPTPRMNTSNLG